jgi:hypothetical protein
MRVCTSAGIEAREIRLPWAFARAIPAFTRSLMSALSNCANDAMTVKIISPCGVVVSMFS